MLQYSVQLPPLSLSSSKPKARKAIPAPTDLAHDSSITTTKRTSTRSRPGSGPAHGHSLPLAISTSFQPQPPSVPSPLAQPGRSSPLSYSPSAQSSSFSSPSLPPTPVLGSAFPFPQQNVSRRLSAAQLQRKRSTTSPFITNAALPSAPVPVPGTRSPRPQYVNGLPSPSLGHSTTGDMSSRNSYYVRTPSGASSHGSSFSSTAIDVLAPGDKVGEGLEFQGESLWRVPINESSQVSPHKEPAQMFEVVRRLGTGSYAVVYLVREILHLEESEEDSRRSECESDGEDLDMSMDGHDSGDVLCNKVQRGNVYGKEYAIKLLSKANLDEEALTAQMFEATIHQSLPSHPNIVTLHRTLETPSYLLLLLEFVPGEDLFYFLEQARDHYDLPAPSVPPTPAIPSASLSPSAPSSPLATSPTNSSESHLSDYSSRTPPTPSLLATLSPNKLLSRTRLRLIASMFKQMCDAVAACHERGVYHRDIKPENFIVTDGVLEVDVQGEKRRERRVVVKLSDFGLSTTDMHSADMDCGSAPYMSFECRNNIHPTYMPRAADVWSLGIVLINMLYHYNPWTDTTEGVCPSFTLFRQNPTAFFMTRFSGMTQPVAEFLANKVFCLLPNSHDDSARISAREFGQWIRDLPDLLAPSPLRPGSGHSRTASFSLNMAEMQSHRLASIPHSRRPSLRSGAVSRDASLLASQRASWAASLSRAPSFIPTFDEAENIPEHASVGVGLGVLPAVPDQEGEEEQEENEHDQAQESSSRTASTQKRRKRGARKGKGKEAAAAGSGTPSLSAQDKTLEALAGASQALARELSKTSRHSSTVNVPSPLAASAVFNSAEFAQQKPQKVVPTPATSIVKKPSKWRLGFGKSSSNNGSSAKDEQEAKVSSTASNVTNLIMGLSAPEPKAHAQALPSTHPYSHAAPSAAAASTASFASHAPSRYAPTASANSSVISLDDPTHIRGRKIRGVGPARDVGEGMWGASTVSAFANSGHGPHSDVASTHPYLAPSARHQQVRAVSPASTSAVSVTSASTASSNWRSSMASSSAATSTSAFTRYSNGSVRSVSTAATSVSNNSWRSGGAKSVASSRDSRLPPNIKVMNGQPWELSELPRQMYLDPENVKFSSPPPVRKRVQKPKNSNLDTISERPAPHSQPASARMDASTSTTDLNRSTGSLHEVDDGTGTSPRKVQKGQINALAKMLSALRR